MTLTATEAERLIYHWCTREGRGTPSARSLAAVYAATHLDAAHLICLRDLRVLDETRLGWALALVDGYIHDAHAVPWARAVALTAMYDLIPDETQRNGGGASH